MNKVLGVQMDSICRDIRRNILKIANISGHGHLPTCFSVIEILFALYSSIRHDPDNPGWDQRDIFILSKGHASLGLYCVLAEFGYFDIKDVETFGAFESKFGCHIDRKKLPAIEASTGSLGHGIGLAVGMALAFKIRKSPRKVYVLIGDGESNEGSVWEALMVAGNLNLDNLTIIYDDNRSHSRGLQITNPVERFGAFGCKVIQTDGHDIGKIREAILSECDKVKVIVAKTTKGYGCRTFEENQYQWHRKAPDDKTLNILIKELDEKTV